MKKYTGKFHILILITLVIFCFASVERIFAQVDKTCPGGGHKSDENIIIGRVNFFISTSPPDSMNATHGMVKLFRINPPSLDVVAVDSAEINSTGHYALFDIPHGDYYIVAYPNDKVEDYMVSFYPSGQSWSAASRISIGPGPGRTEPAI